MEANQYLNDFYNHYDEDSRLLFQHGSVEFLTTMRYIEKYLKHGDKVLEIGAGTGRYSHALARRGHPVDAVELVEHNIEVFRAHTQPHAAHGNSHRQKQQRPKRLRAVRPAPGPVNNSRGQQQHANTAHTH